MPPIAPSSIRPADVQPNLVTAASDTTSEADLAGQALLADSRSSSSRAVVWPELKALHGAYYHKEVTPVDHWSGISATVRLGVPTTDPTRTTDKNKSKNLDGFSIYIGAVQGHRNIDAGLSWDVTKDRDGNVDPAHMAFRPFYRRGGHDWHNAPADTKFYWHPGDVVDLNVSLIGKERMRLTVSDHGPNPQHRFSVDFDAPGFSRGDALALKRVTAIDQSGNEGKSAKQSTAKLVGTQWLETDLHLLKPGGNITEAMVPPLVRSIDYPAGHNRVGVLPSSAQDGGESVDIFARRP